MLLKIGVPAVGLLLATAFADGAVAETARRDDSAAHAIAEKFSGAVEARRKAEAEKVAAEERRRDEAMRQAAERAKAEEQEMLARARREAAEREEVRRLLRETEEAEARARAEAEERARREAARIETERQERARAEAAARAAAESRRLEEEKRLENERLMAEERRKEEERKALEAEREAEARRLAEKHNRLREQREAERLGGGEAPSLARGDERPPVTGAAGSESVSDRGEHPRPAERADTRVTVLLVLEPGTRGVRRYQRTADPVLCAGSHCWLSAGPGEPAMRVRRQAALGPANTLGARAWSCRRSLGCVFRGVELAAISASMQPIDLGFLRHHRREAVPVKADLSCEVHAGRLVCGEPIETATWRAWIVPESVAIDAGPQLLRSAVDRGLPEMRHASWQR